MTQCSLSAVLTIVTATALVTDTSLWAVDGDSHNVKSYESIVQRNAFALQPVTHTEIQAQVAPSEELILTGLAGMTDNRRALFMVLKNGKPADFFSVDNDWLTLNSVDFQKGEVSVFPKKPMKNAPNAGEATLCFMNQRKQTRAETKLPLPAQ